jgi:hypothetical protein
LSGVVEAVGLGVTEFKNGDEVYGVTNPQFVGAHAEYAIASATMIAPDKTRQSNAREGNRSGRGAAHKAGRVSRGRRRAGHDHARGARSRRGGDSFIKSELTLICPWVLNPKVAPKPALVAVS